MKAFDKYIITTRPVTVKAAESESFIKPSSNLAFSVATLS